MSNLVTAKDGYVYLVKYAVRTNRRTIYHFWAPSFQDLPDRMRFVDAKLPRSNDFDLVRGTQMCGCEITPPDLDKKTMNIFTYCVKKPEWFERKPVPIIEVVDEILPDGRDDTTERQRAALALDEVLGNFRVPAKAA